MPAEESRQHQPPVPPPRVIAWELTRRCLLACGHCRAAAGLQDAGGDLSTGECLRLLDNIASFAQPILILTGGEPMLREDLCDIAAHARRSGLHPVLATCGALLDDKSAGGIVRAGIEAVSVSLDGATAASHDAFRGREGSFASAVGGIESARQAGLRVQVNTTVTQDNVDELPAILDLAAKLGATTFNPFFLVPTGRGASLTGRQLSAEEYERALNWLVKLNRRDIQIRVTCAPHYQRVLRQGGAAGTGPGGCLGGRAFAFISHRGEVQICGFLDIECGNLRAESYDFRRIWETSEVFGRLRRPESLGGRCGRCEYRIVCGGCRARAYQATGDYLAEEPLCAYQPSGSAETRSQGMDRKVTGAAGLDATDRRLLTILQAELPLARRPADILAERLGTTAEEVLARISSLKETGFIRRIGAVFEPARLGYVSCLSAGRVEPERLEQVAQAVNALPEVTHNYARRHEYNLWFTLTAKSPQRIAQAVEDLARATGVDFRLLPSLATYKINAVFALDGSPPPPRKLTRQSGAEGSSGTAGMTKDQQRLIGVLQGDLGVSRQPFDAVAASLGWTVERVIRQVSDWLASGVIRRFGAVAAHRRLGFVANGLAVFAVPEARVGSVGQRLADMAEVSHCYRRQPFPGWRYNLFAMFHGRGEDEVQARVDAAAREAGVMNYDVLFSTVEYKKTSARFIGEEPAGP